VPKIRIGIDGKKKPRPIIERGSLTNRKQHYLFPLLDALSGLIFVVDVEEVLVT
jgi:hypothetical protein